MQPKSTAKLLLLITTIVVGTLSLAQPAAHDFGIRPSLAGVAPVEIELLHPVPDPSPNESGTFRFLLKSDPQTFKQAFLVYDLEGLTHWAAVPRSINGLPPQGGLRELVTPAIGPQVEEINPSWLRRGLNEVRFGPVDAAEGLPNALTNLLGQARLGDDEILSYRIENLRLAVLAEDGRVLVEAPSSSSPAPSRLAAALVDDDLGTLWDGRDDPHNRFRNTVDLPFRRLAQPHALEFAISKPAAGSLLVEVLLPDGGSTLAGDPVELEVLEPGWHRLALDEGLDAATGLRLSWNAPAGERGALGEVRVLASPVGSRRQTPRLVLSHPSAGEMAANGAYLRGFVEPMANASGPAEMYVDGVHVAAGVDARSGAFDLFVPHDNSQRAEGGPWDVELELVYPDGTRLGKTVRFGGNAESGGSEGRKRSRDKAADKGFEQRVKPGEPTVLEYEGVKLEIPADALAQEVTLTIEVLTPEEVAEMDTGMANVTAPHLCYRFGPDGQKFQTPIRITVPFDPGLVPDGLTPDDVKTYFFDPETGRWLQVERVDVNPEAGTITSLTDHFTDFVNATLTVPDQPSGTAFEPNSLTDLAQADPAAGITVIEAPSANPDGTANLTFPLELPPGRRGLAPSLALTYSSAAQNGWMGVGWDLSTSTIEVDTRFGVPRYDATETYLLDGRFLAPTATSGRFVRRVEGEFQRIVRQGGGPESYWWEVTNKDGTRWLYGSRETARLRDPQSPYNTFRWFLDQIVDLHGNTVDFHYATDRGDNGEPWVETYVSHIDYTGGPGIAPYYRVVFHRDAGDRPDRLSTGRPGFKVYTRFRLDRIDVRADVQPSLDSGVLVRRYLLHYREGDFSKTLLEAISVLGEDGTSEFYRHELDYFPMPRNGNDIAGFEDPESWQGMDSADDATHGFDVSGGAHAFVGLAPNAACQGHLGVQAGFNLGGTHTRVSFADLNGDGLPDRLNESGNADLNNFDSANPQQPGGFRSAHFENTTTLEQGLELAIDFGAGAHAPGEAAQLGATWVWSHSQNNRGIADVNGDGFPDLVNTRGGFRVRQNQAPHETGFSRSETSWGGFSLDGLDLAIPQEEEDVLGAFHLSDTLRQLTLPYSGRVELTGAIRKLRTGGDGVTVSIHHNQGRIWHRAIQADDIAPCVPAPGNSCDAGLVLDVAAGDRIYFQASSVADTEADDLAWAPRLTYLVAPPPGCLGCPWQEISAEHHGLVEAFGTPVYVFDAGDDFRLAGSPGGGWVAPARGTVLLSGAPAKTSTADDLVAVVRHTRPNGDDDATVTEIHRWPLGAGPESPADVGLTVDVEPEDVLTFHLESLTQVEPRRVQWTPTVSYEGGTFCQQRRPEEPEVCGSITCDPEAGECTLAGQRALLGPDQVTRRVEPRFDVRRLLPRNLPTASWQAPEAGRHTLTLARLVSGQPGLLLIQGRHRLFVKQAVPAGSFVIYHDLDLAAGEPVFVTLLGGGIGVGAYVGDVAVAVNLRLPDDPGLAEVLHLREESLGGGYHGWFYGEWNGDETFRDSALDERPTEGDSDFLSAVPDGDGTDNVTGPVWVAAGFDLYHSAQGVKPSRRGMNAMAELDRAAGGSGGGGSGDRSGGGPGLLRKSYGNTYGVNVGGGGLGISLTRGFSATQLDFFDINGDRFPDQLTPNGVRFSDGRGGFGDLENMFDFGSGERCILSNLRCTEDANVSISFGLGIPFSKKDSEGNSKAVVSTLPSVGTGVSLAQDRKDLVDVNGDGLPDRVEMSPGSGTMSVRLNLGYRFGGEEQWPLPQWSSGAECHDIQDLSAVSNLDGTNDRNSLRLSRSGIENAGLAVGPIGGGVGTTLSRTLVDLVDVNGDGLPDHVQKDDGAAAGYFRVKLNLGDRWAEEQRWQVPSWGTSLATGYNPVGLFQCLDAVSLSGNVNINGSGGFPYCIPLVPPTPVAGLQIEVSVQLAGGTGGLQVFFQDLDGDGFADHVLKKQGDGNVYVKRNRAGKVNLLRTVLRPLGGIIRLDYRRQGNRVDYSDLQHRVDMPDNRWVLATTTVDDGRGADPERQRNNPYTTTWEYFNDAFWDRQERVDYGFARIRERRPDGSTVTTRYHNQDFYRRQRPSEQVIADAAGDLFVAQSTEYRLCPVGTACNESPDPAGEQACRSAGTCFVAPVHVTTSLYEGTDTPKTTDVVNSYDDAGNLIREVDFADQGSEDDTITEVIYDRNPVLHLHLPVHIRVEDARHQLLRERHGTYDEHGNLVRHEATLSGGRDPDTGAPYSGRNAVWSLTYDDDLGTATSVTDPVGYERRFAYDAPTQTQLSRVEDSFGYVSTTEWNLRYGLPELTTDQAGASMRREYDGFGRLSRLFGPEDLGSSEPALAFAYYADARPASAVVRRKDVTRSDPIDTAVFLDGLGRTIQVQADTEVDQGSGSATRVGRQVSGTLEFDVKGRVAAKGHPVFVAGAFSNPLLRNPPFVDVAMVRPTRLDYDVLDRVTRARFPQGTETTAAFGIEPLDGVSRLLTTRTDAEGRVTLTYVDLTGVVRGVEQMNRIGGVSRRLVTRYEYNPLSELISVTDPGGNTTELEYDTLGRRVIIDSPDAGRIEARYDLAGNLRTRIPAHLAARGQQIRFLYTFNRLERIDYPQTPDVVLTYGEPGAAFFRANRPATVTDESGTEEQFYGSLGNVTRTVKTATALNGRSPKGPWETRFERDSFNRLLAVTYPDGEVLSYGFDAGGRVQTVSGQLRGIRYGYVAHQGYDVFGDRARIVYGNGTESRFTYDPISRFFSNLLTHERAGREIQDLDYTYNRVGTLVEIANEVPLPRPSQHGGPTAFRFQYDDLYQLVYAEGEYRSPPNKRTVYTLDQAYDEIGNLTAKRQLHDRVQPSGKAIRQKKTSFDWSYVYGGSRPHAVTHLGERTYHYDESGNQTGWDHDTSGRRRTVVWTEESRVRSVADNGRTTRFLYDAEGRRTNKQGPHGETIYVNPFFSVRNGAIGSKHVFVDGVRVATQVAQPSLNGSPTGPGPEERKRYFYHPDHLGSAHFVTDEEGEVYQHLEYFPSGELWVSERSETQRTPYLFSGKELDEETGLTHFGARYYEARQGQWISPDPIFENLFDTGAFVEPDLSLQPFRLPGHLYAYVSNDPINLVDPEGLAGRRICAGRFRHAKTKVFFTQNLTRQSPFSTDAFKTFKTSSPTNAPSTPLLQKQNFSSKKKFGTLSNQRRGLEFQAEKIAELKKDPNLKVFEEITFKFTDTKGRFVQFRGKDLKIRVDAVILDINTNLVKFLEFKASLTADLSKAQREFFWSLNVIENAVVVGKGKGEFSTGRVVNDPSLEVIRKGDAR